MRILFAAEDMDICSWHRCQTPANALNVLGHEAVVKSELTQSGINWCDVLVCQRLWEPTVLDGIEYAKSKGKLTVYEVDDDYWSLHDSNPVRGFWTHDKLTSMVDNIRACNRATVTTRGLADVVSVWQSDVRVLPNMLRGGDWAFTPRPTHDPLVIGWAGSHSHRIDLEVIRDVLPHVLNRNPNVIVRTIGVPAEWVGTHERMEQVEPVEISEYPDLIAGFDIALAPLADTRFNRSKSDLKVLEYAACGVPSVASGVAYAHTPALIGRNAKDWLKHLNRLIADKDARRMVSEDAVKWARTRTIDGNVGLWEAAYS